MGVLVDKVQRARARLLGTAAAEIPAPFQLQCICGQTLSGLRQTVSSQIDCPKCGATRFVLPVNVYPSTRRVPSEVVTGGFSERFAAATKELWKGSRASRNEMMSSEEGSATDEARTSATDAGSAGATESADETQPVSGRRRKRASDGLPAGTASGHTLAPPAAAQLDVKRIARRTVTPFRLLMLGAVVIVVATGGWMIQQRRLSNARHDWRRATDAIGTAMTASNFDGLSEPLARAVAAAETLNKRDAEARRIANLKKQTDAVNQVSAMDLIGELERCYLKSGRLDETRIADLQRAAPLGMQFFECPLEESRTDDQTVQLKLPLFIHAHRVRIQSDAALLRTAAAAMKGSSLLFTARIATIRAPPDGEGEWLIELSPEGCALLTTELHSLQLGLLPSGNPALQQQLARQAEFIETVDVFELEEQDRERMKQQRAQLAEANR